MLVRDTHMHHAYVLLLSVDDDGLLAFVLGQPDIDEFVRDLRAKVRDLAAGALAMVDMRT